MGLKKRLDKLESLIDIHSIRTIQEQKQRKYSLADWEMEDIKKVVFPVGRDCFDPADKELINKWNDTNWLTRDLLKLLSDEEKKILDSWVKKEIKERGLVHEQEPFKESEKYRERSKVQHRD
jgi:hypothetical protein